MTTTLYRRGRVGSPVDPFATALLVDGGVIAWVGGEVAADAMSADVTVELEHAWVAPAFVDAHVHATATGLALSGLDLTGTPSLAVALDRVALAARQVHGGVLLGTGWDDTDWPEGRPPTAAELDRASYGGVVYLARTDAHSAVASSALLAAAPGARVAAGFVGDGLVRQDAHHVVRRAAYAAVTPAQRRAAQRLTLDRAATLGIACVHECGGPDIAGEQDFLALLALEHPVRRIGYWGELDGADRARELGAAGAGGDLFADGSLGSHTACLNEPYLDEPTSGHSYLDAEQVARHVAACTFAGLQAGFHAIGDAALGQVLAGVGTAAGQVGLAAVRAARHRVEHAEMLTPALIDAMAAYGLVASVQPTFDARWGGEHGMYARRLGAVRARTMNPYAALAAAGVALAFGSDTPVTPLDPWGTVRAAVRHQNAGSGLSPRAAFWAHTGGGWRAARIQDAGKLTPGAAATFAGWDLPGDLVEQPPEARYGVGGLPDLSQDNPVCRILVVAGQSVSST